MTDAELDEIESALDIQLPASYRKTMRSFPIPAYVGNSDAYLWDDASKLIEENLLLRKGDGGSAKPWPQHFYCLGRAGGGDVNALDLRTPEAAVWWVDHSHLDLPSSFQSHASFDAWLAEFVRDTLQDLVSNGIDPNCTPAERLSLDEDSARQSGACLMWVIGVALTLVALVWGVSKYITG